MTTRTTRGFHLSIAVALYASIALPSLVRAGNEFHELRSAEPQGTVEIFVLTGSIELTGWNRPQIEVTGGGSDGLGERVHISGDGDKISIHVRPGGDERLVIHVPERSEVKATMGSADLKVQGIKGDVNLRTISGNISGEVGGDLHANTATGSIRLTARGAKSTEVRTINGNVDLKGGSNEVEIQTVSGRAKADFGTLTRARFHSISGNLSAHLSLAPDAEFDADSISGNLRFHFAAAPSAEFDIQSFSGNIDNCFGPKAEKAHYGPGQRLEFRSGAAQAHVSMDTKSGDVHLCTGDLPPDAAAPGAPDAPSAPSAPSAPVAH